MKRSRWFYLDSPSATKIFSDGGFCQEYIIPVEYLERWQQQKKDCEKAKFHDVAVNIERSRMENCKADE